MGEQEERADMNLLEQNLHHQTKHIERVEKETHERFGKIEGKIERLEERQHRQENDINSVKADVTFIKDTVQGLANDWKKQKDTELEQKNDQLKQFKGLLGRFFVGIAVTVIGAAFLVAVGLK